MKGEVGKENPKKEMDFYDVTHDVPHVKLVFRGIGMYIYSTTKKEFSCKTRARGLEG